MCFKQWLHVESTKICLDESPNGHSQVLRNWYITVAQKEVLTEKNPFSIIVS